MPACRGAFGEWATGVGSRRSEHVSFSPCVLEFCVGFHAESAGALRPADGAGTREERPTAPAVPSKLRTESGVERTGAVLNPVRKLSVVVPVCNEAENVGVLLESINGVLEASPEIAEFEVIVIDDGSDDGTAELLAQLADEWPFLTAIIFRRNFGKSAALMAGFAEVSGDVVITLDGDLQDDPKDIPRFLEELQKGYDLVSGWKQKRQDSHEKVLASRLFNYFSSRITGVELRDMNCGFKAYRTWVLRNIRLTGNSYRFLPVFVHMQGGKISEIPTRHHKRMHGVSKYGFRRYFHGFFDMLTVILVTRFFQRPLYFFALIGAPMMVLGLGTVGYLLGGHALFLLTGNSILQLVDRPLLWFSAQLAGIGLQIILIGLLAELVISRTDRPTYSIRHRLGVGAKDSLTSEEPDSRGGGPAD